MRNIKYEIKKFKNLYEIHGRIDTEEKKIK